jgi:hypothetical protein
VHPKRAHGQLGVQDLNLGQQLHLFLLQPSVLCAQLLDLPRQLLALGLLAQARPPRRLAVALLAPHALHLTLIQHPLKVAGHELLLLLGAQLGHVDARGQARGGAAVERAPQLPQVLLHRCRRCRRSCRVAWGSGLGGGGARQHGQCRVAVALHHAVALLPAHSAFPLAAPSILVAAGIAVVVSAVIILRVILRECRGTIQHVCVAADLDADRAATGHEPAQMARAGQPACAAASTTALHSRLPRPPPRP